MKPEQPRIVFLDAATYGDLSFRRFTDRWHCSIYPVTSPEETAPRVAGHSIAVTNKVVIDKNIFGSRQACDLKLIVIAATGTDVVDRAEAAKHGVKVCNVPGYATQSVAQFTLALILELVTQAGKYIEAVKAGAWQRSPVFSLIAFPAVELNGKTLGIIGYGSIGQAVAQMARGLGMKILVAGRQGTMEPAAQSRIPVEQLFREADIVSLHCPLTSATRNLINAKSLALMKPTAFLINTARGALVDEPALIAALRQKRIAGAALDVLSREPPSVDHPMIQAVMDLDNLIITPHAAWSAQESRRRLFQEVEENILAFLDGRDRNRVA